MNLRDRLGRAAMRAAGAGLLALERVRSGVTWNPFDTRYASNPYPLYARLRSQDPVHRTRLLRGVVLTRYRDVLDALHDERLSADERNQKDFEKFVRRARKRGMLGPDESFEPSMLRSDAPDHTRLRKLVSKAFTPRAVAALEPKIERIVAEQLDAVADRGEMDVIRDLATPLPVIVIAEMIGVPREDRDRFKEWSEKIAATVGFAESGDERAASRAGKELRAYFEAVAEERRRAPRDDLMSGLLAAEEAGDKLTTKEVFSTLELLLIAGNETTTNLIGNGLLALLRNPDQLERLQADPDLIGPGIDELIRYDGPVQGTSRIVNEDLELFGVPMEKGENVVLLLGAANRDPERFPDPDRLDLTRPDNVHVGFGHGVHYCLGSNLARLEARHALRGLIQRFPQMKLAVDQPRWKRNLILHGMEALPVRF